MIALFVVEGAVHLPVGQGVSVDRQALIEEARRKTRRRRIRNGAVVLLAVGVGVAGFLGLGGQSGGSAGSAAQASGGQGPSARLTSALLPHLPATTSVWDFAFDAGAPDTVYVATINDNPNTTNTTNTPEGRIYKSSDSGGHWRLMLRSPRLVLTLAADPQRAGILYAGTEGGILKTLDGGLHWRALSRWPLSTGPYRLTVDPADSRIVYASSGSGISRSDDGGHHWKPLNWNFALAGSQWAVAPTIAFAPTNPKVVYALWGYKDPLLMTSTDSGKTWHGPGLLHIAPGVNESSRGPVLAVDPQKPTTLYVALGHAVIRSSDAGQSWRSIAGGLPGPVDSFAVDPQHAGTVYAALGDHSIYKTTNAGRTWRRESTAVQVLMLAINPAQPATIYAAGNEGIATSTNNGRTWITRP
jgi:photosystem II stability/assembly factor-like uncharacterized protein